MTVSRDVEVAFNVSLSCLGVLIVILNTAVIALVFLNKNIRSYTNLLVVSLACSDILTGGVLFPLFVGASKFAGFPYILCIVLLLGVANVCCVTYDRYLSISSPLTYAMDIQKRFKIMLTLCWLVPIMYSLIPLIWSTNPSVMAHKVYIAILEICGVVIPFVFIFSIYCYIFKQVWKCNKRLKCEMMDTATLRKRRKTLFSEAKIARVFATVAIIFLLSWAPILYMTTISIFATKHRNLLIPDELHLVAMYAVSLGSSVNPILYCFLKPDIRAAWRRSCRRNNWNNGLRASFNSRTATANITLGENSHANEHSRLEEE